MKISKIQQGLVLGILGAMMFLAGCELIVDFDRTKIPVETPDTGLPDVAIPIGTDAGADASTSDASSDASDASGDASDDAGDGG